MVMSCAAGALLAPPAEEAVGTEFPISGKGFCAQEGNWETAGMTRSTGAGAYVFARDGGWTGADLAAASKETVGAELPI